MSSPEIRVSDAAARGGTRKAFHRLGQRPDFKRNPVLAVGRRIWWRVRWAITDEPWQLNLADGLRMVAPKGGAGALIYYLGQSEPEVAAFLKRTLTAGMTFWDIGAHLGEYSLLASKWVGSKGYVEAFEPQPDVFEFLRHNVEQNSLSNVAMHRLAVSDCDGWATMSVHSEPSQSFLSHASVPTDSMRSIQVRTRSLDAIVKSQSRVPDVLKVDAEGAEDLILDGATALLELPESTAPIWVMESEPDTCARFGYHPRKLLTRLTDFGFITYWLLEHGHLQETSCSSTCLFGRTIVASKRALTC